MEAKKMKNEMQLRPWFIKMCAFLVVCSIMIATSEPAQKSVRAASAPVEREA